MVEFNVTQMDPMFISRLYSLPDNVISRPFRGETGYHIVIVHSRSGTKPASELREEIVFKINKDERSEIIRKSFMDRLRKEYPVVFQPNAIEQIATLIDSNSMSDPFTYEEIYEFDDAFDEPAYTVCGKTYTLADIVRSMESNIMDYNYPFDDFRGFIKKVYEMELEKVLEKCEFENLSNKYPEYKQKLDLYMDGLLIYEITNEKVWNKSEKDTIGLRDYYETQKRCYMWPPRIKALVVQYDVRKISTETVRKFMQGEVKKKHSPEQMEEQARIKFPKEHVKVMLSTFMPGDNKFADRAEWKKNTLSNDIVSGGVEKAFVYVIDYIEPYCKSFDEVRHILTPEYQKEIEANWEKELKKKYSYTVNEAQLRSVIK